MVNLYGAIKFVQQWSKEIAVWKVVLKTAKEAITISLFSVAILVSFVKIFHRELFGEIAEEKEVKGIVSKVMEARRSKSYDSYEILAKYVGKNQVIKFILPLKEVWR